MSSADYEITQQGSDKVAARFAIDGTDGYLRAEMSDDYPPSSSGQAGIHLSYGDIDIEAYARDGEIPHIRIRNDDWADTVDGYCGEPITDEAIEDWNEAAAILEDVTGQVIAYTGTEIFYQGQADWKDPRPSKERIEEGLDHPVRHSNTSRVETVTDDPSDLGAIISRYEPELEPLASSGALTTAWERFIECYEENDFSAF